MKLISQNQDHYTVRLDPDEELIATVQAFCEERGIQHAWLSALGSAKELELAYYDLEHKEYQPVALQERVEIVNITGNIALKEGKAFCHAHGTFSRADMSTLGGHINRCAISATCEVRLEAGEGEVRRTFDETTGLHILE
jgi:uncharacterized protein